MATKAKAKATPRATKHLVHEFNEAGQHRIIILTNGIPDQSAWFERREVAYYKGLFANAGGPAALPRGIFRVSGAEHSRLAAKRIEMMAMPEEKSDPIGGVNG